MSNGISRMFKLYDVLLSDISYTECLHNVTETVALLAKFGLTINLKRRF